MWYWIQKIFKKGIIPLLVVAIASGSFILPREVSAAAVNYKYYIGPWVWYTPDDSSDGEWQVPKGTVGVVDLRTFEQAGTPETPLGVGFFAVNPSVTLNSDYVLLGEGDIRTISVTRKQRSAWEEVTGYAPKGNKLVDLLWDQLTAGSDAKGVTSPKPLMPDNKGKLELYLGGHSSVKSEDFDINTHPHKGKVEEVLQETYRQVDKDVKEGKARPELQQQVLDFWTDKYKINKNNKSRWERFVPEELREEAVLKKHETVITDDFNRTDADPISNAAAGWAWTIFEQASVSVEIFSNRMLMDSSATSNMESSARADSDLSSSDMYTKFTVVQGGPNTTGGSTHYTGPAARFSSSANTHYAFVQARNGDTRFFKNVAGTRTQLTGGADIGTYTDPHNMEIRVEGSTIEGYYNDVLDDSITDTSITDGLRGGVMSRTFNNGQDHIIDDFETGDLGGGANSRPTISSVTDSPDPVVAGDDIDFQIDWADSDAEGVKAYVCKANATSTAGCDGSGTWASQTATFSTTDPVTVSYTTSSGDIGANNYYAFVCDDQGDYTACSDVTSGTFTVNAVTTILDDGTDGGNSTIGPGASATEIGRFSLVTTFGTDTVTDLNVTLGPTNAYTNIATIGVYTTGDSLQCSATPSSDTTSLTSCDIPVTTTPTDYVIKITPKSHANMPAVPGATYDTTATITTVFATNSVTGSDTDSATITVDNLSPDNVTSATATGGDTQVSLSWTNPADADLTTIMVLASTTAITFTPTEGTTYSTTTLSGASRVACYGFQTSCTDTSLSNGTAYYYKIFALDSNGNWSETGVTPTGSPATPATIALSQLHYRWRNDNGSEANATYASAEDTANTGNLSLGDRIRLRILLANTGSTSATNYEYQLEYSSGACSAWSSVEEAGGAISEDWAMDVTSNYADGDTTTNSEGLTDYGDSFQNGYSYRRAITIDSDQVPNTDQTNFPVLISGTYAYLATEANGGSVTDANGYDVIFTSDSAGETPLDWEVERYTGTTGEVIYWVEVPTLSSSVDTTIYMFYGNDSISTDQSGDPYETWNDDYKVVYHMDNNAANTTVSDSAIADMAGTYVSENTSAKTIAGKIGSALDFDGSTDYITVSQGANYFDISGGAFTVQAWVQDDTAAGSLATYHRVVSWYDGSKNIQLGLASDSGSTQRSFYLFNATSGNAQVASTGNASNGLRHVVATYDGASTYKMYVDGQDLSGDTLSAAVAAFTSNSTTLYIGQRGNGAYTDGIIDELRISSVDRSADWILTEYNNQSDPASFYSIGSELTASESGFVSGLAMSEDSITPTLTLAGGEFTELEYSIRSTREADRGVEYCFRLTNDGSAGGFTYSVTPRITLKGAPSQSSGGGGIYIEGNATPDPQREGGDEEGGGDIEGGGDGEGQGGGGQGGGGGDLGFLPAKRSLYLAGAMQAIDGLLAFIRSHF